MKRIEQMYAFIALDPTDNTEGIPAFRAPDGTTLPLVGADMERIESLRPLAREIATTSGNKVTLARFEVRTDLEEFEP